VTDPTIAERLEYLRGEIRHARISYSELAELQDMAEYIEPGDVELLEWAGVPEFPDENDEQEPRSDPDGWHEQTDAERIAYRGVEW
jgi:hypothetical protein